MKVWNARTIKKTPNSWMLLQRENSSKHFLAVLLLLCQFIEYGGSDSKLPLSFSSMPRVYKEEVGSSIMLLCKVNNLGDSIIVWKQPDRIISAGSSMIRKDVRMSLLEHSKGINLQIRNLNIDDAGNYICEVENDAEPIQQLNQLQILVPPKITTSHTGQNLTVKKDSSLKLSCNASGFPSPTISWQRQHRLLPSGEKRIYGDSLWFHRVSRSDSGTYICTADNNVGPPVTASIDLNVIYEPEIEVDKSWVHGGLGYEAVISCIVYGDPLPSVRWYRDTMVVAGNENRIMEQFGFRHQLVILSVRESDFGNYSCLAENDLGKSRGFIELSGRPNEPQIQSDRESIYSDQFNMTWVVESFDQITSYRIIYRKYVESSNSTYDTRSRWHNIVLPDIHLHGSGVISSSSNIVQPLTIIQKTFKQIGSYVFFALEPNTKYEVRLQAKNGHGWSSFSSDFLFSTRSRGDVPKELPVETLDNDISDHKLPGKEAEWKADGSNSNRRCAEILFIFSMTLCIFVVS